MPQKATVSIIAPADTPSIGIDAIRELYRLTRSSRDDLQVIIIDDANTMTTEAQNAFLKLLEEPRNGVHFVLLAPRANQLLPTILSRVQQLQLHPLDTKALAAAPALQTVPASQQTRLLFMAAGRPGTLHKALLDDAFAQQHARAIGYAKQFIAGTTYDKLLVVAELAKHKTEAITALEATLHIITLQLQKQGQSSAARQLLSRLADSCDDALLRIERNANIKTQLLTLATS